MASSSTCRKCGSPILPGSAFCPACGTPVSPGVQQTPQAPISGVDAVMKESGAQTYWVRRIVAFVVDAAIVYVALAILLAIAALPLLVFSGPGVFGAIFGGVFTFLAGFILILYFVAFEVLAGGSIGKRVMGLKVVSGGRAPNGAESLVRNISKIHWILLLLDVVVGLAISKEFTQKYSDKVMGTSVVNA